jgi:hypothetical protein
MSHAKRMVLVDEETFHRHKESYKKPLDEKIKSRLNRNLKSYYDENDSLPEDIKAKLYRQKLHKFLNTTRDLPATSADAFEPQLNDTKPLIDLFNDKTKPLLDLFTDEPTIKKLNYEPFIPTPSKKQTKAEKKRQASAKKRLVLEPLRRSARARKQPNFVDWDI